MKMVPDIRLYKFHNLESCTCAVSKVQIRLWTLYGKEHTIVTQFRVSRYNQIAGLSLNVFQHLWEKRFPQPQYTQ